MASVDEDDVTPEVGIGADEFRHGGAGVSDVQGKAAGKGGGHKSRHRLRVWIMAYVERVNNGLPTGRKEVEAGVANVEAGLTNAADSRSPGEVVQDKHLLRQRTRVALQDLVLADGFQKLRLERPAVIECLHSLIIFANTGT